MRQSLSPSPVLQSPPVPHRPVATALVVRFTVREALGTAMVAGVPLLAAGRLDWWPPWALAVVTGGWAYATGATILRTRPDLLAERLAPRAGTPSWDRVLMSVVGVLTLGRLVVAGLDHRFGWSSGVALEAQLLGLLLCGVASSLMVAAVAANPWFSSAARLQPDRAQQVAAAGPYELVRHPGYLASTLLEPGVALLLGSWWALLPGLAIIVLFVVRTAKEDALLRAELPGYAEYAARTRFRLIPGLW